MKILSQQDRSTIPKHAVLFGTKPRVFIFVNVQ